jgi:hypothetical protein
MKRLGTWRDGNPGEIDSTEAPLTCEGASIAHVALVYSALEGNTVQPVPSMIVLLMALSAVLRGHYDTLFHLIKLLWEDLRVAQKSQRKQKDTRGTVRGQGANQDRPLFIPTLPVRQDEGIQTVLTRKLRRVRFRRRKSGAPDTFQTVFLQLQNDVAMYVCSNDMRAQIRRFVLDALLRLASRHDVSSIVINAHSNGTVVAFDALCALPPVAARKIKALVTAGSPLRKYTTLFSWGQHLDLLPPILVWKNFWDAHDPVADPLLPCFEWRRCNEPTADQLTGLYRGRDPQTGKEIPLPIEDLQVNNVTGIPHGQGLVAHNYWDNKQEFIPHIAHLVKSIVSTQVQTPSA